MVKIKAISVSTSSVNKILHDLLFDLPCGMDVARDKAMSDYFDPLFSRVIIHKGRPKYIFQRCTCWDRVFTSATLT